jgi:hypothetical protein
MRRGDRQRIPRDESPRTRLFARGTDGSNPSPSSDESAASLISDDFVVNLTVHPPNARICGFTRSASLSEVGSPRLRLGSHRGTILPLHQGLPRNPEGSRLMLIHKLGPTLDSVIVREAMTPPDQLQHLAAARMMFDSYRHRPVRPAAPTGWCRP